MARRPGVAVALCLLVAAAGVPPGAGASPAEPASALALAQEFDRAQFRIAVAADGSARWTFHYERTLANDSERRQFEAFAADFVANDSRLYRDFRNQSRTLVDRGAASTGRPMAAEAFARDAFVSTGLNDVGVVEMAFTWSGFARTDGDRVVVGDVFEGGLYIGAGQSLVIRAGEGLSFRTVEPTGTLSGGTAAASDTVTWQGERTFADNHPRVVLTASADGQPVTTDGSGSTTAGPGGTGPTGQSSTLWPTALVLVILAAGAGGFLYRRRTADGDERGDPASAAGVDELALLDDEERIEGLLRDRGGRMRQSAIVEATGWSKSKVSMVLSEMEEADQVRKLRVGRENIVSLPGHEPDAAGSPLDDE